MKEKDLKATQLGKNNEFLNSEVSTNQQQQKVDKKLITLKTITPHTFRYFSHSFYWFS